MSRSNAVMTVGLVVGGTVLSYAVGATLGRPELLSILNALAALLALVLCLRRGGVRAAVVAMLPGPRRWPSARRFWRTWSRA
jgi:hypothetical protein